MEDNGLGLELFEDEFHVVFQDDDIEVQDVDEKKLPSDGENQESVAGEDQDEEPSDKEPNKSLPNLYSSLAKALKEEGFLSDLDLKDDEEIESFDKLGEKIKQANNKAIQDALGFGLDDVNSLTDLQKEYLLALKAGVPTERFVESKQAEFSIESITDEDLESNEELRKELITRSYIAKGIDEAKAKRLAQTHIDLAEDIEEAKSARDEAINSIKAERAAEIEFRAKQKEEQIKQYKEYEATLKGAFFNTEKIGEIFDVPKQVRDKMYESVSKPVAKTEDGTLVNAITKYQIENPIDFQHKLAWFYTITDGFKKFDTFVTKKSVSKAALQLESVLNSTNFDKMGNVSNPLHDDDSTYGVRDFRFDEEA